MVTASNEKVEAQSTGLIVRFSAFYYTKIIMLTTRGRAKTLH